MTQLVHYRPYEPSDLEDLIPLVREFGIEMAALDQSGHRRALSGDAARAYASQLLKDVSERDGIMVVAVVEDEIVGFIQGVIDRHDGDVLYTLANDPGATGWVGTLYVSQEFRGQGIARQLMKNITEFFRRQGCTAVHLLVFGTNSSAHRLYESEGFQTSELEMVKPLN